MDNFCEDKKSKGFFFWSPNFVRFRWAVHHPQKCLNQVWLLSAFTLDVKSMLNENLGGILGGTQC
jgi:hypothetical protein